MKAVRLTGAPRPSGTRSSSLVEVLGPSQAPIPDRVMTWCAQARLTVGPHRTLPQAVVNPGPAFPGWAQAMTEIAHANTAGTAVLTDRSIRPDRSVTCVVAALQELPDDIEVLLDATGCAHALGASLLLVQP